MRSVLLLTTFCIGFVAAAWTVPDELLNAVPSYQAPCVQKIINDSQSIPWRTVSEYIRCLDTVEMPIEKALEVHQAVLVAMNYHSFTDRFPQLYERALNFLQDFGAYQRAGDQKWTWGSNQFVSEWRFNHRMAWLTAQFGDKHIQYVPSIAPFQGQAWRPAVIRSRYNESTSKQEYYFAGWSTSISEAYSTLYSDAYFDLVTGNATGDSSTKPSQSEYGWDAMKAQGDAVLASGAPAITKINGVEIDAWIRGQVQMQADIDHHAAVNRLLLSNFNHFLFRMPPQQTFPDLSQEEITAKLQQWYPEFEVDCSVSTSACDLDPLFETIEFNNGLQLKWIKAIQGRQDSGLAGNCSLWQYDNREARSALSDEDMKMFELNGQPLVAMSMELELPDEIPLPGQKKVQGGENPILTKEGRDAQKRRQNRDKSRIPGGLHPAAVTAGDMSQQSFRTGVDSFQHFSSIALTELSTLNNQITSYLTSSKDLAYLTISTMYPGGGALSSSFLRQQLLQVLGSMIEESTVAGNRNLLIDLSGNGGGLVWLQAFILKALWPDIFMTWEWDTEGQNDTLAGSNKTFTTFPEAKPQHLVEMSLNINSRFLRDIVDLRGEDYLYKGRSNGTQLYLNDTLREELGPLTYAAFLNSSTAVGAPLSLYPRQTLLNITGGGSNYTEDFWWRQHENFTGKAGGTEQYRFPTPYFAGTGSNGLSAVVSCCKKPEGVISHQFTNVTIITDGRCGSACSMFETKLRTYLPNVRVITVGGWKDYEDRTNNKMQSSNFCGGGVFNTRCLANSGFVEWDDVAQAMFQRNASIYYPYELTFNAFVHYRNASVPIFDPITKKVNTPRQFLNLTGTEHWWVWAPSTNEKILKAYPETAMSSGTEVPSGLISSVVLSTLLLILLQLEH